MPHPIASITRLLDLGSARPRHGAQAQTAIVSPLQTGTLNTIAWSELFDAQPKIMTRGEAMSIPAVAKARAVLVSLLADKPIKVYEGDVEIAEQPGWLTSTKRDASVWHRQANTIDDLLFFEYSLWLLERDEAGKIVDALHWPADQWELTADNEVVINAASVPPANYLLIPSPGGGLLQHAKRSMFGAIAVENAWIERTKSPIPVMELHDTGDANLDDTEAQELVDTWDEARAKNATAYTPRGIEVKVHGQVVAEMYEKARNASRVDIANHTNLPAAILDGSLSTASLTYSTQEGSQNELALYALPYITGPLEGVLSADDVVGERARAAFDLTALKTTEPSPSGTPRRD